MARRRTRLCGCGCDEKIKGRKSKRFINDTHSKRFRRNGGTKAHESAHNGAENGSQSRAGAERGHDGDVRVLDTDVYCSGCHRPRPGWLGPLQVRYFCWECTKEGLCPCENRPAWHGWVYGGGERPH